jgi:hypothetical protein
MPSRVGRVGRDDVRVAKRRMTRNRRSSAHRRAADRSTGARALERAR